MDVYKMLKILEGNRDMKVGSDRVTIEKCIPIGEKLRVQKDVILREGIFGSVHRGFWKETTTENEVIVKMMKKADSGETWEKVVGKQVEELNNHENILRFYGYEDDVNELRFAINFT